MSANRPILHLIKDEAGLARHKLRTDNSKCYIGCNGLYIQISIEESFVGLLLMEIQIDDMLVVILRKFLHGTGFFRIAERL